MADRQQFILNLKHRPAFGRDDFFVAECNQEALSFIDLWPNWPGPLVWLYGPPGCGKSHLAAVWQEQSGANQLDQAQIISESISISRNFSCFCIDLSEGIENERSLLSLYNAVAEQGGSILTTSLFPPATYKFLIPDLGSRLRAAPVNKIAKADDELLESVLIKLFIDRQLRIQPEVISYLVRRMDRSLSAACEIVELLDKTALAEQRMITVPLVRSVMKSYECCN